MKFCRPRFNLVGGFCLAAGFITLSALCVFAQWPFAAPTTPAAQRNALEAVRAQVEWLQNATRTAPNQGTQGCGNLWQQFDMLRGAYGAFKQTLTPRQLTEGANSLAEIDAGLDIIQEAFANYQTDLAAGRPASSALRELCQVLREGSHLWWQELKKTGSRLRVGWG